MLLFDNSGEMFNKAANFMATNPAIKIIEPVLFVGFILHIFYSLIVTFQNWRARPTGYAKVDQSQSSTWSSRNMIWLGILIFCFLAIHLANFFIKIKFGDMQGLEVEYSGKHMHDSFTLVTSYFALWWYDVIYIVGAFFLGLHLYHAFWSAFQTIGWSNDLWRRRLTRVGLVYAIIVAGGFITIPAYFLLKTYFLS